MKIMPAGRQAETADLESQFAPRMVHTGIIVSLILLFALSLASTSLLNAQSPSIHYTISMPKPWTHLFEVEACFENLPAGEPTFDVMLPVWRSGRYIIFDLSGSVVQLKAYTGSELPLSFARIDKSTWRIQKGSSQKIVARYTVFANDFNIRKCGLNDEHAFINGAMVFLYNEQYRKHPVTLTVIPYNDWHVTTGLEHLPGKPFRFVAENYDHLLDCPLEVGTQQDIGFSVDGVPHVLSLSGSHEWNTEILIRDMSKLIKTHKDFWGSFPYTRYVFLVHIAPNRSGGTEYLNSTILGSRPFRFTTPTSHYGFLGLVSHEFFHTWNVKQLRPAGMHPYDYQKENYAREYWIAEGMTSYFSAKMMMWADFVTEQQYLGSLAASIHDERSRPGNAVQSLTESSFDAWIKQNKPGEQSNNFETNFYNKGSQASLILDLEIRNRSGNKHSLGDVLRAMLQRYPVTGPGYTIDDVQHLIEEFSGSSFELFFRQYIHGTTPLPWEKALGYAGLQVIPLEDSRQTWLGAVTADQGEKTRITLLVAGSPAYNAGLDVGDELIALNGSPVRTAELSDRIAARKPGETVRIAVLRNDRRREFDVTLQQQPVPLYRIVKDTIPTPLQKKIYDSWLLTH